MTADPQPVGPEPTGAQPGIRRTTHPSTAPVAGGDARAGELGAVLVVVILLAVAILGLAHALLVASEAAYTVGRAHARLVELDARATGGVESELERGWRVWMDSVSMGGSRSFADTVDGVRLRTVTWRRLDAEAWIVAASVRDALDTPPTAAAVRARRLAWVLQPAARVGALKGVVSVGTGATVDIRGRVVTPDVPALATIDEPAVGLLDLPALLAVADPLGAAGTPGPVESGGACVASDPWNWGDPSRPDRPCGPHFAFVGRSGSLEVVGGEGQGVLVVDGDLRFRAGARFHGLAVASGTVTVTESASLEGRVIAFGGLDVGPASQVVGSSARVLAALTAVRPRLAGRARPLHPAFRLGPG